MRGPKELEVGKIRNISIENVKVSGPYRTYKSIPWNYISYRANDYIQNPHYFGVADHLNAKNYAKDWQFTSNICGLKGNDLENIKFKNIDMTLFGGVKEFNKVVPETPLSSYPECYAYGKILPASGFYFRHIKGLTLENIKIRTIHPDCREQIIQEHVK